MNSFYHNCLFLVLSMSLLCGCAAEVKEEVAVPDNVSEDFRNIVSDVQLIPLEESGDHLLGPFIGVQKCNDSYIVLDRQNTRLYRYSSDGHFINTIGNRGNGPEEYLHITNIQILDGSVVVFSYPSKILYFAPDGTFVKSETVERLGLNSYLIGGRLLSYYGYSGDKQYRLWYKGLESSKNDDEGFLHYDNSVIDLSIGNNMFSEREDGSVLVLDSYSNVVSVFDGKDLSPYVTFDFGKYSIDKKFFEAKDPFEGAEYIINGNLSLIHTFVTSESMELVQIDRKKSTDEMGYPIYGIKRTSWEWYSFLKDKSDSGPSDPFQFIQGDSIFGVIDPDHLPLFLESYKSLASNWDEVADDISGDNHVIVKFSLK